MNICHNHYLNFQHGQSVGFTAMAVMIPEGRASLWSFLLGASVIIVGIIGTVNTVVEYVLEDWLILVVLLYSVVINVLVLIIYRPSTTLYQVMYQEQDLIVYLTLSSGPYNKAVS